MKKYSLIFCFAAVSALFFTLTTTAYAAEALTDETYTFSYPRILPVFIGGSLVIEALFIMLFTNVKRIVNVSFAALVANTASFLIPRFVWGLINGQVFYSEMFASKETTLVFWAVSGLRFAVTLVIELPILWVMLRAFTNKTGRIMLVASAANLVTCAAVAVVELQLIK